MSAAIEWTYCECGCHGCDAYVGPIHFWHFMRLDENHNFQSVDLVIDRRQGSYPPDKTFETMEELDAWCISYAREELKRRVSASEKALAELDEKG